MVLRGPRYILLVFRFKLTLVACLYIALLWLSLLLRVSSELLGCSNFALCIRNPLVGHYTASPVVTVLIFLFFPQSFCFKDIDTSRPLYSLAH